MFLFYNSEEFARKFIAQTYEQTVNGLKLTPAQDKELRELYSRSVAPVRIWGDIFIIQHVTTGVVSLGAGIYTVVSEDLVGGVAALSLYMWAWAAVIGVKRHKMKIAKKQLDNKIAEIKTQNLRQISR